ncbi:DUF2306 domain-containing protein [Marinicella sp. W31]|uniref:DUF2306 domain-containing protein n=1 Tax=Marinicella sp. W31 TaxID=3023713 RepID=UPI003757F498
MTKFIRLSVFTLFSLMCIGVAFYAFYYLHQQFNVNNPFHTKFAISGWVVPGHFFGAGLALLLVPLQMSHRLRQWSAATHRTIGYLSVAAILIGGVSGLIMAFDAHGGWVAGLGFGLLSVLWLTFTGNAIRHAIRGNIRLHQIWMYRSIALTSAAITLRVFLGLGLGVLHLPFLTVYVPAAWLCWVVNLMICELLLFYVVKRRPEYGFGKRLVSH